MPTVNKACEHRSQETSRNMLLLPALALALAPCDKHSDRCVTLSGASHGSSPMPLVALGTWRGSYKDCADNNYTCVREKAQAAVGAWIDLGGTHIDGANDYRTQVEVAAALRAKKVARKDVYITTKCPGAIGYAATIQCAEDALQMLGQYGTNTSGYVDLLLIHFPDVIKPECMGAPIPMPECEVPFYDPGTAARQETWKAMELLQKLGRARAIGLSDYNTTHLEETLAVATKPIALHQVEWHPLKHDEQMLAFCQKHGIQLQAWSPLGGAQGSVLSNPVVKAIASAHGRSTAQVVLKWSLQRGVAVVTGTDNKGHMASDLDLWGTKSEPFVLTDKEMHALNNLSPV
jgi:diketogulonate reductase-like aldo/keto reductase